MLYMELPVAAFEAQRAREQSTIDRGNEYAHAVKLFVRKIGRYPSSIEELESTNQMRFLRRRYKDPLTGKDDWRLLHAGPGGQLMDSKVNPIGNNTNANGSSSGSGTSGFSNGTNSASSNGTNSGFGKGFDSDSASNSTPDTVVLPVRQRPPAIPANGAANAPDASASAGDQNPMAPLLEPGQTATAANGGNAEAASGGNAAGASAQTASSSAPAQASTAAQPGVGSSIGTGSGTGTLMSGGIAGVASKAGGNSIKTVNDQDEYSLWEFYYDPTKDAMRGMTNAQRNMTGGNGQNPGTRNGFGQGTTNATPTTTPGSTAPNQQQ